MEKQKPSETLNQIYNSTNVHEFLDVVLETAYKILDEQQSEIDTLKAKVKTLESTNRGGGH